MQLLALPAFDDNYIWLLHSGGQALVVDPGDAAPVLHALRRHGLGLAGILVTHHHGDHTGGVAALQAATGAPAWASAHESLPPGCEGCRRVGAGQSLQVLGLRFDVLHVPGHTAGHVAYFCADAGAAPLLFCGDTLFSAGCGRLFEGTPAQMLASLDALAALPPETRVCAGHEYTLANLRFAQAVEPANADIAHHRRRCEQRRAQGLPTLPATLALERAINPFLRSRHAAVVRAVRSHAACADDDVAVFAALREWKNAFK